MQNSVKNDVSILLDQYSGLLRACQLSEGVKHHSDRLQLQIQAARLVEASKSLLGTSEKISQETLLADFETCNEMTRRRNEQHASDEAAAAQELQAVIRALYERLEASGASERFAAVHIGATPLLLDTSAALDTSTSFGRMLEIAGRAPVMAAATLGRGGGGGGPARATQQVAGGGAAGPQAAVAVPGRVGGR